MSSPSSQFTSVRDDERHAVSDEMHVAEYPTLRPSVVDALLRNWPLVLAPAIILAFLGAALAFARPAVYTSEARLSVGKANPSSPAFGGFVTAAAGLATVYSRAIDTPGVVDPVGRQLHLKPGTVAGHLSATPIQDSPIIRVIGTGSSAHAAEVTANAGAAQLVQYVTNSNRQNPDIARLFGQYQIVSLHKAQNDMALGRDNRGIQNDPGNGALRAAVTRETARGNLLGTRLTALSAAIAQAEESQASTSVLWNLSNANSAASNRSARVQTLAGVGLLAGLVIGVALAMWRATALMRRRLAS